MKSCKTTIFVIAAVIFYGTAHADGGSPPGQLPQQANGWKACVPNGSANDSSGPPDTFVGPTWQARWISLAVDGDKAILGRSSESSTEAQARQSALQDCESQGGTTCHVFITAKNGCIAMVAGAKRINGYSAPTTKQAETQAIKDCEDSKDTNCKLYYSACVQAVPR